MKKISKEMAKPRRQSNKLKKEQPKVFSVKIVDGKEYIFKNGVLCLSRCDLDPKYNWYMNNW